MTDGSWLPLGVLIGLAVPLSLIGWAPPTIPRLLQSCSSIPSNLSPYLGPVPFGSSHWVVANPAVQSLTKRLVGLSLTLARLGILQSDKTLKLLLKNALFEAKLVGVIVLVSLDM